MILLLPLVFFGVGAALFAFGYRVYARNRRIALWPRARGRMLRSGVESRHATSTSQQGATTRYMTYRPALRFEYEVGGQRYESGQIARSVAWMTNLAKVQAWVARYPEGPVDVLYDPAAPATAYLEAPTSGAALVFMVIGGVVMSIVGLLVGLVALAIAFS